VGSRGCDGGPPPRQVAGLTGRALRLRGARAPASIAPGPPQPADGVLGSDRASHDVFPSGRPGGGTSPARRWPAPPPRRRGAPQPRAIAGPRETGPPPGSSAVGWPLAIPLSPGYAAAPFLLQRWMDLHHRLAAESIALGVRNRRSGVLPGMVQTLGFTVCLTLLVLHAREGHFDPGRFVITVESIRGLQGASGDALRRAGDLRNRYARIARDLLGWKHRSRTPPIPLGMGPSRPRLKCVASDSRTRVPTGPR